MDTQPWYPLSRRQLELRDSLLETVHQWRHRHPGQTAVAAAHAAAAVLEQLQEHADREGQHAATEGGA